MILSCHLVIMSRIPPRHMFVKCVAFQTSGERNVFEPRFVSQEFDVVFMPTLPDDAIKVCINQPESSALI